MILITGGAGYIGSHANKSLSGRGYKTLVFDNLSYGHKESAKWGRFIRGDLSGPEQIRGAFRDYKIRAVMHFAGYAYVGESVTDPQKYYLNNVSNTLNLLQAMLENRVDKFIFSSSCSTYGIPSKIPIPEEHPQNPINPYGRTKLIIEKILADYSAAYGLKYASLRYFNAAGADPEGETGEWHDPETHLIPRVLDAAIDAEKAVEIYGNDYDTADGTCVRDYIHVTDLAEAHILALGHLLKGGKSGAFNLGNGKGFSVKEVVETAREITGKRIAAEISPRRPGDPPVLLGTSAKAEKILGWKPRFPHLHDIIETAWNWHKKLKAGAKGHQGAA